MIVPGTIYAIANMKVGGGHGGGAPYPIIDPGMPAFMNMVAAQLWIIENPGSDTSPKRKIVEMTLHINSEEL